MSRNLFKGLPKSFKHQGYELLRRLLSTASVEEDLTRTLLGHSEQNQGRLLSCTRLKHSPRLVGLVLLLLISSLGVPWSHYAVKGRSFAVSVGPMPRSAFIDAYLARDMGGPANFSALQYLCQTSVPQNGLVFEFDGSCGGIGNVRNFILTTVRYALEAGAGIVIPQISKRSEDDISQLNRHQFMENMDYLFDVEFFVGSLEKACPRTPIFRANELQVAKKLQLQPEQLGGGMHPVAGILAPGQWRGRFDGWLRAEGVASQGNTLVQLDPSLLLTFPVGHDSPEFVSSFGRLLRLRYDTRRLAAAVLYQISLFSGGMTDPQVDIFRSAFCGAHLRTEQDAQQVWGTDFEGQSDSYLFQCQRENLKMMYVATGSLDELEKVKAKAQHVFGITVVSKATLLRGTDLASLNKLTWDQQALVDYQVLLRASTFAGFYHSTFSWNVALRRHVDSIVVDPFSGLDMLVDEYSHVYGRADFEKRFAFTMWP